MALGRFEPVKIIVRTVYRYSRVSTDMDDILLTNLNMSKLYPRSQPSSSIPGSVKGLKFNGVPIGHLSDDRADGY